MTENRPRVLVVDDVADAADSLATLLMLWGYEVRVAYGGTAALETASTFGPQVVTVDLGMPGVNGFRLVECLRNLPGVVNAAVIAVTGHDEEACRVRGRELKFAAYLLKPVDPDLLQNLLAQFVGKRLRPKVPPFCTRATSSDSFRTN